MMKVLVTCPPMLGIIDEFRSKFQDAGVGLTTPDVVQILSEGELIQLLPEHDGWIAGDDAANRSVLTAGTRGRLRALVKWGVGTDNVDWKAAAELGLRVSHTPGMFGPEVADVAMAYVAGLARELFLIDRHVRGGHWPKPRGLSLSGRTMAIVGLGDIGSNLSRRAMAAGMHVMGFDPRYVTGRTADGIEIRQWSSGLETADFIVLTCPLTRDTYHMLGREALSLSKHGVRIVNVARGPLIDEAALVEALQSGRVHSAALDVMEIEPLPLNSTLRQYERCVFGSHNSSNTVEAVRRASAQAVHQLFSQLGLE